MAVVFSKWSHTNYQGGNRLSTEIPITSGIIQGGHQSPICFAVFINDLPEIIKEAIVSNFADDTKLYLEINSSEDTQKLQNSINDFAQWCVENDLDVNEQKCHVMTVTRKNNPLVANYMLNGKILNRVQKHKDLGIIVDSKLTMIPHVEKQINKAKGMLGLIKRISGGIFSMGTMRTLYMSLVRSHIDYASEVYTQNCVTRIKQIESVQRRFVEYALNEQRDENHRLRPYMERCSDFNLQSLARRSVNTGILFIYDLIERNIVASTLNQRIEIRQQNAYNFRNSSLTLINIPNVNKDYLFNNPFFIICRYFNKVSDAYVSSVSRNDFKRKIESLPDNYFDIVI